MMRRVDLGVKLLIVALLAGIEGTDAEKTPAQKRSEAMKKLYEDPEFRKRQAQGSLETWQDPEYREKISRARREQHARGQGGRGGGPK